MCRLDGSWKSDNKHTHKSGFKRNEPLYAYGHWSNDTLRKILKRCYEPDIFGAIILTCIDKKTLFSESKYVCDAALLITDL